MAALFMSHLAGALACQVFNEGTWLTYRGAIPLSPILTLRVSDPLPALFPCYALH